MEAIIGSRDEATKQINRRVYDRTVAHLRTYQTRYEIDLKWAMDVFMSYFLSHQIPLNDCMIASAAKALPLPLYSTDKHFRLLLPELYTQPY